MFFWSPFFWVPRVLKRSLAEATRIKPLVVKQEGGPPPPLLTLPCIPLPSPRRYAPPPTLALPDPLGWLEDQGLLGTAVPLGHRHCNYGRLPEVPWAGALACSP